MVRLESLRQRTFGLGNSLCNWLRGSRCFGEYSTGGGSVSLPCGPDLPGITLGDSWRLRGVWGAIRGARAAEPVGRKGLSNKEFCGRPSYAIPGPVRRRLAIGRRGILQGRLASAPNLPRGRDVRPLLLGGMKRLSVPEAQICGL